MQPRAYIRCEDPGPRDNETRRIIAPLSPDEIQQWRFLFREFPPVFRNLMKREEDECEIKIARVSTPPLSKREVRTKRHRIAMRERMAA